MNKDSNHKLLVFLLFNMMTVYGLIINLKSQMNPLIQQDYNLNNTKLSIVVVAFSIGGMLISLLGGRIIQRFSLKKFLFIGVAIGSISLIGMSYVNSYSLLLIMMMVSGFGVVTVNVAGNTLASRVFIENKGRMMNIFHLFFGLGGYLAPYYADAVFKSGYQWEMTYSGGIIFLLYLIIFSVFCRFPQVEPEEGEKSSGMSELIKDPRVIIFALMSAINVGAEVGIISWMGVYLNQVANIDQLIIGRYISWFFGLFIVGRLIGSIFVERVGYLRWVLFSIIGSLISLVLAVFGPPSFLIFFSITGLFISTNFPNIQAAMFSVFDKNLPSIVGVTLATGELGNLILVQLLIGKVNDMFNLKIGYLVFIFYLLILAGLTYHLKKKYIKE